MGDLSASIQVAEDLPRLYIRTVVFPPPPSFPLFAVNQVETTTLCHLMAKDLSYTNATVRFFLSQK